MLLAATPSEEVQKIATKLVNGNSEKEDTEEKPTLSEEEPVQPTELIQEPEESPTELSHEPEESTEPKEEGVPETENTETNDTELEENNADDNNNDKVTARSSPPTPEPEDLLPNPEEHEPTPEPKLEEQQNALESEPEQHESTPEPEKTETSRPETRTKSRSSSTQEGEEKTIVEAEDVIEGVVNGENEVETLNEQGQGVAESDDNDDSEISALVDAGNMEQLASLVLNGEGERLIGQSSDNAELQSFLDNVSVYMVYIKSVLDFVVNYIFFRLDENQQNSFSCKRWEST